jgi:hypothetical protein
MAMHFLDALCLAEWVNAHSPIVAAPSPREEGWAVAVHVPFFDDATNTEHSDRQLVENMAPARAVLGY